jgi:phosphodiesterase/alkaline phosphatase D-like protein
MRRRPGAAPTRAGRRAVLAKAAGIAAAGLAIDPAGTGRILAAVQRAAPAVDWMWSGAITPGSARVRARVTVDGPVRLIVTRSAGGDGTDGQPARIVDPTGPPSTDGVHTFDVDGLQPDTVYRYAVETAAGRDERIGRFRTFADGRYSFAFAFGSCASTGSNNLIFDTIRRRAPHFFLHLGDFHYANIGVDDPWRFRDASNRVLRSPRQSALYRETPIVYVFDDHDFGKDDADGTSVTKAAVQRVYRERAPHYPLPLSAVRPDAVPGTGPLGPIAQAFTVGRARIIVTDTRSERTPQRAADAATRTMLGPAQRQWLVDELTRAADEKAPVVFWANTVPWITKENPSSGHGWEPYAHERAEIAGTISKLGLTSRLIVLSGDAHMAAIDDGTNSNYVAGSAPSTKGVVVVQAAPFSRFPRSKGGPYSHGRSTRNHQFGWVEVRDAGDALTVHLSCRNQVGLVIPGLELTVTPR